MGPAAGRRNERKLVGVQRLSVVRCFASYLHALDPAHEIPPADVLARRIRRAVPYLYTEQEIWALMAAH